MSNIEIPKRNFECEEDEQFHEQIRKFTFSQIDRNRKNKRVSIEHLNSNRKIKYKEETLLE